MGDIFEKLGNLLNEKIENELQDNELQKTEINIQHKTETKNSEVSNKAQLSEEIPLTEKDLSTIKTSLTKRKTPTAERIPAGNYTEDIPIKIITGTASFPSSSD
ncbi:MAG: hypothetical protein MJ185_10640 [Treponema sp.]|nr:hypothetical protein [Treponema sp.]